MEQKVIQIGNSAGIILPQVIRQQMRVKIGDKITINKTGDEYILSQSKKKNAKGVNANFVKIVDEFMEEHKDVLEELARH